MSHPTIELKKGYYIVKDKRGHICHKSKNKVKAEGIYQSLMDSYQRNEARRIGRFLYY